MIFEKMTKSVDLIMNKILHQQFNRELSQGKLPKDKFIFYMIQDSLYLSEFSKALAITSARLSDNDHSQKFIQFSLDAITAERNLHSSYLKEIRGFSFLDQEQNPACFMYTNYLLRMANLASIEEAVASLLPCFWVYREVGKAMLKKQNEISNPYHEWIALYSSKEFDLSVSATITITNDLAKLASDSIQNKMIYAFKKSTLLECLFWDAAYHKQVWSV